MFAGTARLLKKAQRRLWMKYALRGVGGSDNHSRLDLAYSLEDPWNMDSSLEQARFEATNAHHVVLNGGPSDLLGRGKRTDSE